MAANSAVLPYYLSHTPLDDTFYRDMHNVHLIYDYNATDQHGKPAKWRYEIWFFSPTRVVYAIHGGPMAGRKNYQKATYQCIRPGELWQVNFLEETGTICSLVFDLIQHRVTALTCFSQGHWENSSEALGDKRNTEDFDRWRRLAVLGKQTDRMVLSEQADIVSVFKGIGDLMPIREDDPTF